MERLTHEADFGLEDWEETLFFVPSPPGGAYNILDIAKYQGEPEFDEILKNVSLRLAAYENTGLEPGEIVKIREDVENGYLKSTARRYGISVDRLRELAQADLEDRCVILPCKVGSTVWVLSGGEVEEKCIEEWRINAYTKPSLWADISCGWTETQLKRWDLVYGKTVFFTRQEAEEALRREQDG